MTVRPPTTPPTIDFDPDGEFAGVHLVAFGAAPFDPAKQRRFCAMVAVDQNEGAAEYVSRYLAEVPATLLQRMNPDTELDGYRRRIDAGLFQPSGGLSALRDSPPPELWEAELTRMRKGPMVAAGRMLLFIAQMARFHPDLVASTKRAAAVLQTWGKAGGDIPPARDLPQMWKQYGAVAPFYGALQVAIERWSAEGIQPGTALGTAGTVREILSWAAALRDFALAHKPRGASKQLLDADRALILPPGITPRALPLGPLPPKLLTAAQAYRAAVPA